MRVLLGVLSCIAIALVPISAFAETAFVEGHAFDKRTGRPLGSLEVTLEEVESSGPLPRLRVSTRTDQNGFYQFEIDLDNRWRVGITVTCETPDGRVWLASGTARLRDGTIRRDIYVADPKQIRACLD